MQKKHIGSLIIAILLLAVIALLVTNPYKTDLVYVDVNKLIEGYQKTKVAKADFNKKTDALKANVDSLVSNWQNELKLYEKERSQLSPKELELKQELLATKQQQLNSYQQAIQQQIESEDKQITQTLINDINDYIKKFGKENNYQIIFGASGGGNIMYANESTDLTQKVLKGLNDEYNKK